MGEEVNKMQSLGYTVVLVFIDTADEVCQARVLEREVRTGRPVSANFVSECNKLSRESFFAVQDQADVAIQIVNNENPSIIPPGEDHLRIFGDMFNRRAARTMTVR